VDGKAIRMIVVFGVLATLLLTVMMMFTLDQATDTQMPQIAGDVAAAFEPSLEKDPPPPVRLTMTREPGPPARRVYTLRLRPNAAIAAAPSSLATLMYDASKLCALEIGDAPGEVRIHCVAELPGGATKETTWVRDEKGAETGVGVLKELPASGGAQSGTPKR
jgi:hypothetical protein